MPNNSKIYGLVIIAHPDDEAFLFAGTTMKLEEEGKVVDVICATHGEKGADRLGRKLNENQMSEIRTQELRTACSIIGCSCKKFFNFHDGALDEVDFDELVADLTAEINAAQPQVIFTFGAEGVSGHRDHITIGRAVIAAAKLADPHPTEVWLASIPASKSEDFQAHTEKRKIHRSYFTKNNLTGIADEQLTKVYISKYKEQKLDAIKAHQSQYVEQLIWPYFLEYECFEIIKLS